MSKRLLFKHFARVYYKRVNRKRRKNDGKSGNVMVIKCDGIGDFVLFLSAAKAIRRHYSEDRITLVCGENAAYLARRCGYFDEVIIFKQDTFLHTKKFVKFYSSIKDRKFDLLLSPGQPRSVGEDLFAMLVNAKLKIASLGEAGALEESLKSKLDGIYDRLIDTGNTNHTLIQTAEFLRAVGLSDYLATAPKIEFELQNRIYAPPGYFIVFVGGSNKNKKWSAANYRKIADSVAEKTGWACILCGDAHDEDEEAEFSSAGSRPYYSYVGKTNQEELMSLISGAKLVLGNDTCAIHFANAFKVPSVCVKGVDSGTKFFPYSVESAKDGEIFPVAVSIERGALDCYWCTLKPAAEHYLCIGGFDGGATTKCLRSVEFNAVAAAVERTVTAVCNQKGE